MNKQLLMNRIEDVEGREYTMYMLDGKPHIGIGHNIISRTLADETLDFLGIEDESDLMHATLNDAQCEFLLEKDLDIAIADARNVIGEDVFDKLASERQDVLIDMSFNLGRPRFSKFKKMIEAVQAGAFEKAADEILDSNAARNPLTKERYENLAKEMRGEADPFVSVSEEIKAADQQAILQSVSDEDFLTELARRLKCIRTGERQSD